MLVEQTVNEYIKKIENANLLENTDIDKSLSIYLDLWNTLPTPKKK